MTSARSAAYAGGHPLRGASASPASLRREPAAPLATVSVHAPSCRAIAALSWPLLRRVRSWPVAGRGTARAPTGPGCQHGLLPGGQDICMGSLQAAFFMPYPRRARHHAARRSRRERMTVVAQYPDSTKTSLEQRLRARPATLAPDRQPADPPRGDFSYVDATLTDATTLNCAGCATSAPPARAVRDLPRQPRRLRRTVFFTACPSHLQTPSTPPAPLPQRPHRLLRPPTIPQAIR